MKIFQGIVIAFLLVFLYVYFLRRKGAQAMGNTALKNKITAFQYVLEYAEHSKISEENYYTHFGGSRTYDTSRHPNKLVKIGAYKSTAYGRFQYIYSTWAALALKYGVSDISPESQNYINSMHLVELGIAAALEQDDFNRAIGIAGNTWASMPGSPHGQGKWTIEQLESIYARYGG